MKFILENSSDILGAVILVGFVIAISIICSMLFDSKEKTVKKPKDSK